MHLIYKQIRLDINLHINKQYIFQLCNDGLYSIYTFQIKSSYKQEFLLLHKSLNKQSTQYFLI